MALWNYLDDPAYLDYLLHRLYDNWSLLWPGLESSRLSKDSYQTLLLNVPIDFIPDRYRYDRIFMRECGCSTTLFQLRLQIQPQLKLGLPKRLC